MSPIVQPWLRREIINSYPEEYDHDISEVHNSVQNLKVGSQGSEHEGYLIKVVLAADGEPVHVQGRSGNTIDAIFDIRYHHTKQLEIINKNWKRIDM